MHRCYSCRNIFAADEAGGAAARFPARFEGPPGAANGGIIVGALACPALAAASHEGVAHAGVTRISARLHAPVPLEQSLRVDVAEDHGAYRVSILDGDRPLVSGSVEVAYGDHAPSIGDALSPIPGERANDIQQLARVPVPDRPPFFEETGDHPIPGCFSCGPEHAGGMRIFPRVAGEGIVCAPWRPAREFDDGGGALAALILTSALDCSSGICMPVEMQRELLDLDQFFLLGSLDVRYLRVASVERDYRVAAKALLRDGRKFFGLSALFDDAGVPYAMAEATWIVAGMTRIKAFGASTEQDR